MDPRTWPKVEKLYHAALARPTGERDAFLDEACGGDEELRREVQSLLGYEREAERLMERPATSAATQKLAVVRGTRLGPYEVTELIGAGGMGEVYRARDTRLGRDVAVKILPSDIAADPERLRRFEQEARAVASLNHPHILTVHDVGAHEGRPYLVTELLEGETLREVLSRRAPTQRQVLAWAVRIAQGLAAAHAKSIVHRDLKPENLFLTTDGRIKILDFGLAKLTAGTDAGGARVETPEATKPGLLLGTAAYMSPEQIRGLPVDGRSDLFSFGVVLYELLARRHPFRRETAPVTLSAILNEAPPDMGRLDPKVPRAVDGIVRRCLEKEKEERFQSAHDLAVALEAVLTTKSGEAPLEEVEERSPYPGLASFTEKDAPVFFGREAEVAALWEKIHQKRLLAVIGPSGAGKTSFLRAGVLPARPEGWGAVHATPGASPGLGFARALTPELAGDAEAIGDLLSGLEELRQTGETERVVSAVKRWRSGHAEALLVVDQFEELFTLNPPETQARFAALLDRLVTEADVHVLVSLRDDFLMRCQEQEALGPVFSEITPLGALTRDALRRAVVEPARKRGYRFEDETLVDEMTSTVEGTRGALPLLAFAVARLWEKRDREAKCLSRAAYEEIGGVAGALAQHAEATLDRVGAERQNLVREIFRNLVTAQGTRVAADREELLSAFPEREEKEEVLRQLIDARLLTTYEVEGKEGEPSHHRVEVVHESLLRAWPRLVRWQTQDEEGALLRDQLKQAAHLWEERSRPADLLWTGTSYREFELWRERHPWALTAMEEGFARAMTEKARRRRRLRRLVAGSVITAAVVVAAGMGTLWRGSEVSRARAEAEARRAESSKLLALAQLRLEEDPTEALAYATASLELADSREARVFAMKVLWLAPPAFTLVTGKAARGAFFSRDGRWMAVGGHTPEVRVWRNDGKGPIVLPGHDASAAAASIFEGGWTSTGLLVTGVLVYGREVLVWSLPEGKLLRRIGFGGPTWWQVGRNHLFAETAESGPAENPRVVLLRSWQLPDGEAQVFGRVDRATLGISSIVFEPDGRGWLYTRGRSVYYRPRAPESGGDHVLARDGSDARLFASPDDPDHVFSRDASGEIRVWSFTPAGPELARTIPKPDTAPPTLFPDPSGRWLVYRAGERPAQLWDLRAWPAARPLRLGWSGSWTWAVHLFHPHGDWLAVSPDMSHLVLWPLRRAYAIVVDGGPTFYGSVTFSPDGRWLASNWTADTVRLWPLPGAGAPLARSLDVPKGFVWTFPAFDPKLRYLFVVGDTGGGPARGFVVPLDGSPSREVEPLPESTYLALRPAISPSGRLAAGAFTYGQGPKLLRVWNLETGERRDFTLPVPQPASPVSGSPSSGPTGYEGGIRSLAFVDEETLVTAGHGGLRRWNIETASQELLVASEPGNTMAMALSADGRTALTFEVSLGAYGEAGSCGRVAIHDLAAWTARPLQGYGQCGVSLALDPSGTVAATADREGVVRVGRVSGGEPHLLLGHDRWVRGVAISADLRWVATLGEDKTLRLWPMPDLSKPPLHTLPLDALLAKLKSLTNLRVVRDPASSTGWRAEIGPFPGWKEVPTW